MNRLDPGNLPAFYEYDDVPFLVYTDENNKPVAVSDAGIISTILPEIVFEGEQIDEARFTEMAIKRNATLDLGEKYREVLDFARNLK